jgi:hypothetical protein
MIHFCSLPCRAQNVVAGFPRHWAVSNCGLGPTLVSQCAEKLVRNKHDF